MGSNYHTRNVFKVEDDGRVISLQLNGQTHRFSYSLALNLAAWIASVADGKGECGFDEIWEGVANL